MTRVSGELIEWLLAETVAEYESRRNRPWIYDVPAQSHSGLARDVLGFEIEIASIEGAFKLSQDKPEGDRVGVIEALSDSADPAALEIAGLMRCELEQPRSAYAGRIPILFFPETAP